MDLGQRPHTTSLSLSDLTMVDVMKTRGMSDNELKAYMRSLGLQVRDEWDRERLNRTLMAATYEASAARVQ